MALEQLTHAAAAARLATLQEASGPRLLPGRLTAYLQKQQANFALSRMRAELRMLERIEGDLDALATRSFKLQQIQQGILTDKYANKQKKEGVEDTSLDGELSEVVEQMRDVRAKQAELGSPEKSLKDRQATCRKFLSAGAGGAALKFHKPPKPDGALTYDQARSRVLSLKSDLKALESAPIPLNVAREDMSNWVDQLARYVNVECFLDPKAEKRPYIPMTALMSSAGVGAVEAHDTVAILFGLFPDLVKKQFGEQLDRKGVADDEALDPSERETRIARCRADILSAQRVVEAIAWQAIEAHEDIELEADAPAESILFAERV